MSKDLLLGRTWRDWSCGQFPRMPVAKSRLLAEDVLAAEQVPALARAVGEETQANYNRIVHLSANNRMPVPLRKEFGKFLARWYDLRERRQGKFTGEDFVELQNLRDANALFSRRLDEAEKTARSPAALTRTDPPTLPKTPILLGTISLAAALVLLRWSRN